MKTLFLVTILLLLAFVAIQGTAGATVACPPPPCPACPPVEVTCKTEAVSATCNCLEVKLPGLWKVQIKGAWRCGEITVVPDGFVLAYPTPEGPQMAFYMASKERRVESVSECPKE
jgi:hypothetical protein